MPQVAGASDQTRAGSVSNWMAQEQQHKQASREQADVFGGALASWNTGAGLRAMEGVDQKEKDEEA